MKKRKNVILIVVGIIAFLVLWFAINGIEIPVEKNISVNVYESSSAPYLTSSVDISGNIKKTLSSTSFVGDFSIEYYEPSCREGVQAKITWDDGYQNIIFYYVGDFTNLDIDFIEIDEKMEDLMIVFKDGTIIATPNHYIPGKVWTKYKK